ncbi:hypothetical protein [Rheinheimera nanhaiensis]|uniref:Uncharacterized protein n=1 Tax=Rheinheimera nanhaiensis E407-8 TaxID=562729 RepID=I1DVY0_9GAMM|nr:hypothetical protein [Rheinheimera nanhaiensis]GAB58208.1 hypothetical protein RNAN_1179 [Rheinheimera nanhaiensis E407-8]
MKKSSYLMLAVGTFVSFSALARKDCPPAVVQNIQIESNHVLYLQKGYPWRRLGVLDEPGTRERLSALLAAQMAGKRVSMAYKDAAYDCSSTNYSVSAYLLRTYSD